MADENTQQGVKISQLEPSPRLNDADVFPFSSYLASGFETKGATLAGLRSLLYFDHAVASIEEGLEKTVSGQYFHVWRTAERLWVDEYFNRDGVAEVSLNENGEQKSYPTPNAVIDAIKQATPVPVDSFEKGNTLKSINQALRWKANNNAFYSWRGVYPKIVPPNSTPETTGGISESAWVDVSDLTLRSQVAAVDGFKLIGRCPDIATLRVVEPTLDLQKINVIEYATGYKSGGGYFYHDGTDTTTPDNGVTVIVTANGKRWKREYDIFDGVLVDWAGADPKGVRPSEDAFQRAVLAGNGIRLKGKYVVNKPIIITASDGFFIKGTSRRRDTVTKANLLAPNITRTYDGVPFVYDVPCIFAFVADDESYVRHVSVENIETIGLSGDATQVHFFAPRATYCTFRGMLATHGRAIWESTSNSFVNSFDSVRTALMSKHWIVHNGNAYTLNNVYSNGNAISGESVGFEFIDTNVAFVSCDCDGLNIGWIADGHANLELIGCNSEVRLRTFNGKGNSSIKVHGGRHALTVISSQQSQEAACYKGEGNSRITVYGAKAYKFVFDAIPTNKFLAIATGSSKISLFDMQLDVGDEVAAVPFSMHDVSVDVFAGSSGSIIFAEQGVVVSKTTALLPANAIDYTLTSRLNKVIDFSGGQAQTLLTFSSLTYNQMLLANIELLYRASGQNGVFGAGGVATCKIIASSREQNTAVSQITKAALAPDTGPTTIEFSVVNNGASVSIIATASDVRAGLCSFMCNVNAVVSSAGRLSTKVSVA